MSISDYTEDIDAFQVRYRELDFLEYTGYSVGNNGSVWTRIIKGSHARKLGDTWYELKTWTSGSGYLQVALCNDGIKKNFYIHTLHEDDDKSNNNIGNLKWKTHADNVIDKIRNGRTTRGKQPTKGKRWKWKR